MREEIDGLGRRYLERQYTGDGLPVLTAEEVANGWTPATLRAYQLERRDAAVARIKSSTRQCLAPVPDYDPLRC